MTAILDGSVEAQTGFAVHSEVGTLRHVMIPRSDLELNRLTSTNHDDLLYDDVRFRRAHQQDVACAETPADGHARSRVARGRPR